MAAGRSDDPFLPRLRGLHPGQPGDRQRWHRYFERLSAIEHGESLSDSERGAAFVALLKKAWPAPHAAVAPERMTGASSPTSRQSGTC